MTETKMGQMGLTVILGMATLTLGALSLLVLPTAASAPGWLSLIFGVLILVFGLIEGFHMLNEKKYTILGSMMVLYGIIGAVAILGKGYIDATTLGYFALGFWVVTALFLATFALSLGGAAAVMKAVKSASG